MGHSVLPKSTNEARIKENLDIFYWSIPEDLFAKLSGIEQASQSLFLPQRFMPVNFSVHLLHLAYDPQG